MRGSQCIDLNETILTDLVAKRQELAELLGYKSYSAYILEIRMAKKPAVVQKFEASLHSKIMAKGQRELEAMQDLKRDETGDPNAKLESWDRFYYETVQKDRFHKVSEDEIK